LGRMATPYNLVNDNGEPYMRTGIWMPGVNYMQGAPGEPFFDVVNFGGSWYRCVRSHTSSSSLTPSNPIFWEAAINFKNLATDVLLAENAAINLLSSNVINLFNGTVKTASINADGKGSYCIYYPNGKKMMEFNANGFIIYYNNDTDNTVAWTLGYGGDITKTATSDDWKPIRLKKLTLRDMSPSNINANTHYVLDTFYQFIAGSGSQFADCSGKIYTGCGTLNPRLETTIADGDYTRDEGAVQDLEQGKWAVTTYPVVDGIIDFADGTNHYGTTF